ncbi:MAG: hypothetical protein NVSMB59_23890 [Vulcanimicrobiaceae bacterium]
MGAASQSSRTKPLVATEPGYSTTPNTRNDVPESVQGIYIPRLSLEHFLHGVSRAFDYELIDEGGAPNDHLGLVRGDLSPKPAYTALAALLNLLAEPGASAPTTLSIGLSGNVGNVHHVVFHKADGTFYIAYWLETSSFDVNAGASGVPVTVPSQTITMTFGQSIASASNYAYDAQYNLQGVALPVGANSVNVSATDRVSVIKLRTT